MIKVSNFFLLFIALSLICGFIKKIFYIYLIIFLHELGHLIFIYIFKRKINNIIIHPYGIIISNNINNDFLYKDLLIASSGIIINLILFIFLKGELRIINKYVLLFNILPIYPLDGGLIIKIILSKFIPFKILNKMINIISIIFLIPLFFIRLNLNQIGVILILLIRNINELKNNKIIYNNFLINKYLKPNKKLKNKYINKLNIVNYFYKGYNNNQGFKDNYISEENLLNEYYRKNK